MITAEIKVNGCLIGHLYCVNICADCAPKHGKKFMTLELTVLPEDHKCNYEWSYHRVADKTTHEGRLRHKRGDGAEVLISKIMHKVAAPSHTEEGQ